MSEQSASKDKVKIDAYAHPKFGDYTLHSVSVTQEGGIVDVCFMDSKLRSAHFRLDAWDLLALLQQATASPSSGEPGADDGSTRT